MEYSENEGQCLAAEFMAKLAARPIKTSYDLVTLGAKTSQGGEVVSSLQNAAQIREYADDDGIPGLLQAGYVAPTGDGP